MSDNENNNNNDFEISDESNYDNNNNDFEISDNKISDNKISDDKIIVTKNIDFNQRFNNQSQKKIKATNYNTTINFNKFHSKMTKKRGQYQSYQKFHFWLHLNIINQIIDNLNI